MAIMATAGSNGTGGNPVSTGVHLAVCCRVIDLGDQFSERYNKTTRKVMLTWEVPSETIVVNDQNLPKHISKTYTLSLNEKATLRQHLESWRGKAFTAEEEKGFDLKKILGATCQLQILHNENGRAYVSAIMALPKGTEKLQPQGELIYFDLSDDSCLALLDKLPDWVKDTIKQSTTYLNLTSAQVDDSEDFKEVEDDDGDLPF